MTTNIYFEHQGTKKRYRVISFDKEAGTVKLQGLAGAFDEPFSRERFEQMGYNLIRVEEDADAEQ